jgi:hypothetical protein
LPANIGFFAIRAAELLDTTVQHAAMYFFPSLGGQVLTRGAMPIRYRECDDENARRSARQELSV